MLHNPVMSIAPKSSLDVLLEEFQSLIDLWLPIIAPLFGLSELDAIKITKQVDKFVADTEAVEHGQVDVTDGLASMITDILEILKLLGIDWTAPSKCIVSTTYLRAVRPSLRIPISRSVRKHQPRSSAPVFQRSPEIYKMEL